MPSEGEQTIFLKMEITQRDQKNAELKKGVTKVWVWS